MDNIILIGFMGSGKSSVAKALAVLLDYVWCDTDELIEKSEGKTISDIFGDQGEKSFREMETQLLKEMIPHTDQSVISVGGGLPMTQENHDLLKKLGKICYLEAGIETILERLKDDESRPLLRGGDAREKVIALLGVRDPIYRQLADYTICVENKGIRKIAEDIREVMK